MVEATTNAVTPLNFTTLFDGVVLKFDPEIIIVAPTAPLPGENPEIDGEANTAKLDPLVMVTPLTVTSIGPVLAPFGTVVVIVVEVDAVTVAVVPLNLTTLFVGVKLKFVPVMVTVAPIAPLVGLKSDIVGVPRTVKLVELLTVTPPTVTEICPVEAPIGTEVVILLVVEPVTIAGVRLKVTALFAGILLKFVPLMVTTALMVPLDGLKPEIVGEPSTLKFEVLVSVMPLTTTLIGPVDAPTGTIVVILVDVKPETVAATPLKNTEGEVMKLVPERVTVAPTAPLDGLNPVKVGVDNIVKLPGLLTVTPLTVTETIPVVAPAGTTTVMEEAEDELTTAANPLN